MFVIIRVKKIDPVATYKWVSAAQHKKSKMNTFLSNFPGLVMNKLKQGAAWVYRQNYAGMYASIPEKTWLQISFVSLVVTYFAYLYMTYSPKMKTASRANKRKLEEDIFEENHRHIKRRLSIQAEKYRHASAFQTIQQQVGEDPRSWPVILLNEVILLREDLARVQKKEV